MQSTGSVVIGRFGGEPDNCCFLPPHYPNRTVAADAIVVPLYRLMPTKPIIARIVTASTEPHAVQTSISTMLILLIF